MCIHIYIYIYICIIFGAAAYPFFEADTLFLECCVCVVFSRLVTFFEIEGRLNRVPSTPGLHHKIPVFSDPDPGKS